MTDILSDMLTRIRNGQKASLVEVLLFNPMPTRCRQVLILLQKEGFILGFKNVVINNKEYVSVLLKYTLNNVPLITKIKRVSTSGKRIYCKSKHL